MAALGCGSAADSSQAMKRHILHAGRLLIVCLESTGFWDGIAADEDAIAAARAVKRGCEAVRDRGAGPRR